MIETRPVTVEGRVLGVVVTHEAGWHFIATDPLVGDIHGRVFPNQDEARRIAGVVLARARTLPRTPPMLRVIGKDGA